MLKKKDNHNIIEGRTIKRYDSILREIANMEDYQAKLKQTYNEIKKEKAMNGSGSMRKFDKQTISVEVDGITVTGTSEKVKENLKKLGYSYYESESKGLVLAENMDSKHLQNAIIKRAKFLLDEMRKLSPEEFNQCKPVVCSDDTEIHILLDELSSRFKEEDDYEDHY